MSDFPPQGNLSPTIVIGEIDDATLVIESEGIANNDNDITFPTSAAVKDYSDTTSISNTLTDGQILVGNVSNIATDVAVTGDISISNAGVVAIATAVIVNADVNASAAIDYSKLAALTDGNILVGNATNVAVSVNPSGDIDISNAGVFSISSDVIVNADVNSAAAIAYSKLNLTGQILNADLAGSIALSQLLTPPEANATADQTNTEIKTAYEANADTNEFSDAEQTLLGNQSGTNTGDEVAANQTTPGILEVATVTEIDTQTDDIRTITPLGLAGSALQTKVDGIEALADVTDTTNVNAAAATIVGTIATGTWEGTTIAVNQGGTGVTSSTGTVAVVLSTSPTLITPLLGTPTSGVLTNCTGLPFSGIADGTDGELLTWDSAGVAANVAAGTSGQVLTSNGAGTEPTFQAAAGGAAATKIFGQVDLVTNPSEGDLGLFTGKDLLYCTEKTSPQEWAKIRDASFQVVADNMKSYANDAAFDATWDTDDNTKIGGNPTNDNIDFTEIGGATNHERCTYSLPAITSDTVWLLRFKVVISTLTVNTNGSKQYFYLGLSSIDNATAESTQDFIGMRLVAVSSAATYNAYDVFNGIPNNVAGDTVFAHTPIVETIFVEIKRTAGTQYTVTLYSDATYSTSIEAEVDISVASGTDNLKFIAIYASSDGAGVNGTITGTVGDVEFYNGVSSI